MYIYERIKSGEFDNKLSWQVAGVPSDIRKIRRAEYRLEQARLDSLFQDAVDKDLGLSKDHPKYEKIWSMAWDIGHSNGLQAVYDEMLELYELIN